MWVEVKEEKVQVLAGSNLGLCIAEQVLYCLSHRGEPAVAILFGRDVGLAGKHV